MNLESLPEAVQRLIAETGLKDRVVGVATIRGDSADQEAVDRFLLPRNEDLLLSHYTSWNRLEEALGRGSFCMKRIDQSSGDGQSGTYPAANLHSTSAMDADLHGHFPTVENKTAIVSSNEALRTRAFEHCWFEGWKECPKMWRDYGWNGAGVCIQTRSFALFSAAYQASEQFHIMLGGCFYRNDDEPIPTIIGSMPLFCKRRQFSSENEVRLIAVINEAVLKRHVEELEWIPLRSMEFIERLVLGPKMPADLATIVRAKAKQILPTVTVLSPMTAASEID